MKKTHHIKLLEQFADDVYEERKNFEIRENDRGYQAGDYIVFEVVSGSSDSTAIHKTHPIEKEKYVITYMLSGWGLKNGYVALGIEKEGTNNENYRKH